MILPPTTIEQRSRGRRRAVAKQLRPSRQTTRENDKEQSERLPKDAKKCVNYLRKNAPGKVDAALKFFRGEVSSLDSPMQMEIHSCQEGQDPGCPLNCRHCHGQCLNPQPPAGIPPDKLKEVVEDFRDMGGQRLELSGICRTDPCSGRTEPLVAAISAFTGSGGVGLHTVGKDLTKEPRAAMIDASLATESACYVTFSLPALDPATLDVLCRPRALPAHKVLETQLANIGALIREAEAADAPLGIQLNVCMTRANRHTPADALRFLKEFGEMSNLTVRFTSTYAPIAATAKVEAEFRHQIYVPPVEVASIVDRALNEVDLTDEQRNRVIYRAVERRPTHKSPFCLNQLLYTCLGCTGKFYPCQGIAGSIYDHLAYGDVRERRFPEIWRDFVASIASGGFDPIRLGCPSCGAATEAAVNDGLLFEFNRTHDGGRDVVAEQQAEGPGPPITRRSSEENGRGQTEWR